MATQFNLPFSWDQVDRASDFNRLQMVLDSLPDAHIIRALECMRKNGRNQYPVSAMWRAFVAGIVFGHESIESLIRELNRNSSLLAVCGFSTVPMQRRDRYEVEPGGVVKITDFESRSSAPRSYNFSGFLANLAKLDLQQGLVSEMINNHLCKELMEVLPEFGKHLGYDGKAIKSHSTGRTNRRAGKKSDPDANWGVHKYRGVDSDGREWSKVKKWFGYRLHIIADTEYEIPVAFSLTEASTSEIKQCERMADSLFGNNSELAGRCKYFTADRGLDSGPLKAKLWDDYRISPIIDIRRLWREEKQGQSYVPGQRIMRPLNSVHDNILYTETGQIWCRCPLSGKERRMASYGLEKKRGTLKFRCPAAAEYNLDCKGWKKCHSDAGKKTNGYGRVVRVSLERDRRIFTPARHGSPSWNRAYRKRTAIERLNSRMGGSFRFEKHYIRGKAKMAFRAGMAIAVIMALAVGHAKAGRTERIRSLVSGFYTDTG